MKPTQPPAEPKPTVMPIAIVCRGCHRVVWHTDVDGQGHCIYCAAKPPSGDQAA